MPSHPNRGAPPVLPTSSSPGRAIPQPSKVQAVKASMQSFSSTDVTFASASEQDIDPHVMKDFVIFLDSTSIERVQRQEIKKILRGQEIVGYIHVLAVLTSDLTSNIQHESHLNSSDLMNKSAKGTNGNNGVRSVSWKDLAEDQSLGSFMGVEYLAYSKKYYDSGEIDFAKILSSFALSNLSDKSGSPNPYSVVVKWGVSCHSNGPPMRIPDAIFGTAGFRPFRNAPFEGAVLGNLDTRITFFTNHPNGDPQGKDHLDMIDLFRTMHRQLFEPLPVDLTPEERTRRNKAAIEGLLRRYEPEDLVGQKKGVDEEEKVPERRG